MTAPEFDTARLQAWFHENLPEFDGAMKLTRISGGQSNPTFFVEFDNHSLVLRKQPSGPLLPSAHAVDREFRIIRALAGSAVPVPEALCYCDDREVIGTPFYVMKRLVGRIFPSYSLTEIPAVERRAYYMAMAETLAKLHAVDWSAMGLADFGKSGNFFSRQVSRWARQWASSKTTDNRDIDRLIEWLPANLPTDDTTTIVHGDFRMGNLMFHPTEPKVIGVLDWELSTLGHPMADVGYSCIAWHMKGHEFDGILGLDLAAEGLPTQAEFIAHYQQSGGHREALTPFHLALSMFRFAVILEGVAARAQAGNAANADAAEVGALAASFARRAVELTS